MPHKQYAKRISGHIIAGNDEKNLIELSVAVKQYLGDHLKWMAVFNATS